MTIREFAAELGEYRGATMAVACCLDRRGDIRLDAGSFFVPETTFVNLRAAE